MLIVGVACLLCACAGDDTETPPTSTAELPERFDARHVTVAPDGENGLRIREVLDVDFGSTDRHGYVRVIPNDFGVPTDVSAVSPDAPANLTVEQTGLDETAIVIGDPDAVVSGQHRYVVTYTLPDAQLAARAARARHRRYRREAGDRTFRNRRDRPRVRDPTCNVGLPGASGGCVLERDGEVYRVVISPLEAGHGITIGGTITARITPADVPEPPIPPR